MKMFVLVSLLALASLDARAQSVQHVERRASVERTERLLELLSSREQFAETKAQMLRTVAANPLLGQHVDLLQDFLDRVAPYDSILPSLVHTYRLRLSERQAESLIAFYERPENEGLALLLGRVNLEVGQLLSDRVNARMPEFTQELLARLQRP
ncbi:hypothetical protein Strain138_002190 [Pseudogemmatithrix spongiicola]|uniref:DUF2059 domain-containing protein n=1 Tax=Pseudogemmatithrix spongiicola TaxID=3062599 RepID=A0AA49K1B5_9BACT|nr:hypothetical protein Strain138_002190 [Gemmatimonadaceae bacterium 'strain 138']WKW15786.1 hypothetical protein Strain318_002189 [Gemmatimonadaceae bacterium 'strain 318']